MATIAHLHRPLDCHIGPDTSTDQIGVVDPGDYSVIEVTTTDDADYALLELGAQQAWICFQWRHIAYAAVRVTFDDDPLAIDESALVNLFPAFYETQFGDGRYPYPLPGVPHLPIFDNRRTNNCSTFVEALVVRAFTDVHPIPWSVELHDLMMTVGHVGEDAFTPMVAIAESGMGLPGLRDDSPPHPWTVIQGWRGYDGHRYLEPGHLFIVVDHHPATDKVLVLESTEHHGLDGPGYRNYGALSDYGADAPQEWWAENTPGWTWARICQFYRFRRQAVLRVGNRRLSGI